MTDDLDIDPAPLRDRLSAADLTLRRLSDGGGVGAPLTDALTIALTTPRGRRGERWVVLTTEELDVLNRLRMRAARRGETMTQQANHLGD
jgi:hypothetical protein